MEPEKMPPSGDDELRAEMSSADINDLPDSAFAYIEPGGEKDAEGKTTPRSLRHFPVHDGAHARNALAQAPKSPFGEKAMPKILAACKKFGIDVQSNSAEPAAEERKDDQPRAGKSPVQRRRKERHRAIPLDREFRFRPLADSGVEVREAADTNEIIVTGKPIKYGVPYRVRDAFGEFDETMHPGCVSSILDRVDCRFLLNHDGVPMARVKPDREGTRNTMRLVDGDDALGFEARLDARQQIASDFAIALERGDIDEMSVGMIVGRDEWGERGGKETRDIYRLDDLLDVSGVTFAASPTTSIEIARRMALEMPVESRARMRRLEVDLRSGAITPEELAEGLAVLQGHDERAGKVLSGANKDKVATAISALLAVHEASGGDPADFIATTPSEDGSTVTNELPDSDPGQKIHTPAAARSVVVDLKTNRVAALRLQLEARKRRRPAA